MSSNINQHYKRVICHNNILGSDLLTISKYTSGEINPHFLVVKSVDNQWGRS